MNDYPALLPIEPVIQHYDWGGTSFIPTLAGKTTSDLPCAEWWIGAHPKGPSRILMHGHHVALDKAIADHPEYLLGAHYQDGLPFLLKVLDVASMLSIQAHPTKQQAEAGFAHETGLKIPLDAAHRIFKDDNHKPELLVALSDFYLLSGFRSPEQWKEIRNEVPELVHLREYDNQADLQSLYQEVMGWSKIQLQEWAEPLAARLGQLEITDKLHPDYWAKKAISLYGLDHGLVSIYLLQLRHLQPGEGYYQGPGILHAYLEGQNVEIMANSDNVFRGGLTSKHVDVPQLLAHTHYDFRENGLVKPVPISSGLLEYPVPVQDFRLLRVPHNKRYYAWSAACPSILLPVSGDSYVRLGELELPLGPGKVKYVVPGEHIEVNTDDLLFIACVGAL